MQEHTTATNNCPHSVENNPGYSELTRWRLFYASKGVFTTLADSARKKPTIVGWQYEATKDPARIHLDYNSRLFQSTGADGILAPTGRRYRLIILDDDGDLERLEAHLGIPLRGTTKEVRTPSGNSHLLFWAPDDDLPIPGSVGKNVRDGFERIDVRGDGNLAILPPSPGYTFIDSPAASELPRELTQWIRGRGGKKDSASPRSTTANTNPPAQAREVQDGERHVWLQSELGRAHDGQKNLDQLIAHAHACNRAFPFPIGSPGDKDHESDVDRLARGVYQLEPCSPGKPRGLESLIQTLSDKWWERDRRGLGNKNEVRFARTLISEGAVTGEVAEQGLRVELSLRQAAERMKCGVRTIQHLRDRMVAKGELIYDTSEANQPTDTGLTSAAFILTQRRDATTTPPCDNFATPPPTSSLPVTCNHEEKKIEGGVASPSRPRVDGLETAHYRHRGPVGYAGEDAKCHIEGYPGLTREGLARMLGWSRARDLERIHLRPLRQLGLIEVDEEGRYWTPEDNARRQAEVIEFPISTVQRRLTRSYDWHAGRWVSYVAETGFVASQRERDEAAAEYHEVERERLRQRLGLIEHKGHRVRQDTGEIVGEITQKEEATTSAPVAEVSEPEPSVEEPRGTPDQGRRKTQVAGLSPLYGLLDKVVQTTRGPGELRQVFPSRGEMAVVLASEPGRLAYLSTSELLEEVA